VKDYLTEAVTGTRTIWRCARCGGPSPPPEVLEEAGYVQLCPTCGRPLDALKHEEVKLSAREAMVGMPPATEAVN